MQFTFDAQIWLWEAKTSAWHFVSVPFDIADEIEDAAPQPRAGFGSVKVEVTLGETTWRTSLFPSKEHKTFVLPLKKPVLAAAGARAGDTVSVTVRLV